MRIRSGAGIFFRTGALRRGGSVHAVVAMLEEVEETRGGETEA